jgi:hypothetical protein
MSTIVVNTVNPYFIGGYITFNGIPIRNNFNGSTIGIGTGTLQQISTGINNVAVGRGSLNVLTTGAGNTGVGGNSLQSCTGSDNTGVGFNAGATHNSGSNNVFLGRASYGSTPTASNEITLGNSANNVIRAAVTSITSLSDARDKKDIEELPVGLSFIEKLNPVKFVWDDRNEDGRHDVKDFGFIAQELKSVQEEEGVADILKLVYEENPDKLEASYGKLVPVLVKAIQELSNKVKELENKI